MEPTPPSNRVARWQSRALILVFVALLWLPTFDSLWHLDHCPPQEEKRKLAVYPKFNSIGKTGPFLVALQRYFDDHFGFRNQLVEWNNHWKFGLFDESPVETALKGRNGWLYWAQDGMLTDYTGATRFGEADLIAWQKLLETRRDWLAARNEKYIFVIAPDKHTIYPEYLPDWLKKSGKPSKMDQFVAHMREHSTVEILDLRPVLIAAKKDGPTYLQTDTHWNNFGAFAACQELIRALQLQIPRLVPLPPDAFERKSVVEQGGDLSMFLGQQHELHEPNEIVFTPRQPGTSHGQDAEKAGRDIFITHNPAADGKVVVFRDSFADKMIPFLGFHFREAIYVSQIAWNKSLLEREKPDVVIDEMVERHLNTEDPRKILKSDG